MMKDYFQAAPLDMKAKGMTAFFFGIMVLIAVGTGVTIVGLVIAIALSVSVTLFAVRGYTLTPEALIVHHLYGERRFPLAGLTNATPDPGALAGSIRTFGIGGVWGYIGRFRNGTLGPYQAYTTNSPQSIVLTFGQRHVIISPADTTRFLTVVSPYLPR